MIRLASIILTYALFLDPKFLDLKFPKFFVFRYPSQVLQDFFKGVKLASTRWTT
ncbi:MAG: hypothetical protein F6J98_18335 [Moorea sp. SIO4G2]|nr:hypothetical protein [Moorena sp. SIO4G2]